MERKSLTQIVAAGLFAAGAIACADAMTGMGNGSASAQSSCSQWELTVYIEDCEGRTCTPPAGWAPFASHTNFFDGVWMRRCAD